MCKNMGVVNLEAVKVGGGGVNGAMKWFPGRIVHIGVFSGEGAQVV